MENFDIEEARKKYKGKYFKLKDHYSKDNEYYMYCIDIEDEIYARCNVLQTAPNDYAALLHNIKRNHNDIFEVEITKK